MPPSPPAQADQERDDLDVRARQVLARLEHFGLQNKAVARRCRCSASHLSHLKAGDHHATPDLVRRLDALWAEVRAERLAECAAPDRCRVVALDKGPTEPWDADRERALVAEVHAALLAALTGDARPVRFPGGLRAAVVELAAGRPPLFVVALASGPGAGRRLAHELEAVAAELQARAARLRAVVRPRRSPRPARYA